MANIDLDPAASPEELARLIAVLPDGTDLGSDCVGKLGRVLLTGLPAERNPAKYASVFNLVRANPAASPWMRYAAWAEEVNGKRRVKGADMPAIAGELDALGREAAAALPSSPHKSSLLGNVAYNRGIVCRGLRRYAEGARAQRESSAWFGLAGNAAKQDTSLFAAQVETVSAAFVLGDKEAVRLNCAALAALRDYILMSSREYPAWMKDNASIHIAWAFMMARLLGAITPDVPGTYGADFRAGGESRFAAWALVFRTWRRYAAGEFSEVVQTQPIDLQSSSADNSTLSIQLLIALAKREEGDAESAKLILQSVAGHAGPDGGIPIAVAQQLLKG